MMIDMANLAGPAITLITMAVVVLASIRWGTGNYTGIGWPHCQASSAWRRRMMA